MKGEQRAVVELSSNEFRALLDAQKIWKEIAYTFDNMGCDIDNIVDVLDDMLDKLLTTCEDGVLEEV